MKKKKRLDPNALKKAKTSAALHCHAVYVMLFPGSWSIFLPSELHAHEAAAKELGVEPTVPVCRVRPDGRVDLWSDDYEVPSLMYRVEFEDAAGLVALDMGMWANAYHARYYAINRLKARNGGPFDCAAILDEDSKSLATVTVNDDKSLDELIAAVGVVG